jgi:prepilin-type processing-associated H-X9-DG protein
VFFRQPGAGGAGARRALCIIYSAPVNNAARIQDVKSYLCPSDGAPGGINYGSGLYGRSNYLGNNGTTADTRSGETNRVGIFNYQTNGAGQVTTRVRITDISDGTSNTAMYSETTRSTVAGGTWPSHGDYYNPTNVYLIPDTDSGWSDYTPQFGPKSANGKYHCDDWDYGPTSRLTYRGWQYYRDLPEMEIYTHTVPPNYPGYDCGNLPNPGTTEQFTRAHMAARSWHTGGVNACFADGSVHFISNTIDFATWQFLGTRSGGEVLSGSAF